MDTLCAAETIPFEQPIEQPNNKTADRVKNGPLFCLRIHPPDRQDGPRRNVASSAVGGEEVFTAMHWVIARVQREAQRASFIKGVLNSEADIPCYRNAWPTRICQ
jgi:hypothetical protein